MLLYRTWMTYISPDHDLFMGQTHNRGHWRIRPTMDITVHNLGRLSTLSIPMNKLVIYPSLGNIGIYIYIYIYIYTVYFGDYIFREYMHSKRLSS